MSQTPSTDLSFDCLFQELETLVQAIERNEMPLEEAVASYQRGVELIRLCQAKLASAEEELKVFEDGVLKPLKLSDD